ncbi:MAG: prepilin-type N-terminal cleavage/methylation domain-containing protein [Rudaea sp.]|uniref:prepilin-type N-terminal cleavage/methylation domain-containing protein n=1 Tax=Rudaea sp. TaxID=2136325 RepID=UPI0039E418C9
MPAHSPSRASRGHTLIELMIAIVIGLVLILAAFKVLSSFEGGKRTTTAMNDALQSGNFGLFQIDKLVRSAGSGMAQYANNVGYGCLLNYTPTDGTLITDGVVALPSPFTNVVGTATAPLRMVPALILGDATASVGYTDSARGTAAKSDALLLMLGGSGFAEVPVPITSAATPPVLKSIVGLNVGDWVVGAGTALGTACMISKASQVGGSSPANWTSSSLTLALTTANTVGSKTLSTGDYIVDLGTGTAANFVLFGVDPDTSTLRMVDLLNAITTAQNIGDDIVYMKAAYEVDPGATGIDQWVLSGGSVSSGGNTYSYAATTSGLLAGSSAANAALLGIKAIRVAVIVRAAIDENVSEAQNATIDFNNLSYTLFSGLSVQSTWYPPTTQNYRYREIETTVPIRNNGLL